MLAEAQYPVLKPIRNGEFAMPDLVQCANCKTVLHDDGAYPPPEKRTPCPVCGSTARIFLYHDVIIIPPTVAKEFRGISESARRQEHEDFVSVHLIEPDHLDAAKVDALAGYYFTLHRDMDDCRIMAEAKIRAILAPPLGQGKHRHLVQSSYSSPTEFG